MKEKLIGVLQRWGRTVLSPSLDGVHWNLHNLQKRVDTLSSVNERQERRIHDLTMAVLYERWQTRPFVINSRTELGYWLNFRGLFGEGAEVGVHRGEFSELLLQSWNGARLYSVDPWRAFGHHDYTDVCNVAATEQEENHAITTDRLGRFEARSAILRQTSREASASFDDGALDFVYIDAQHHYEAVREDLELWERKVRPGGVLGGHDYLDGDLPSGRYGVKRAVDEWSEKRGYSVLVTNEGPFPSWFIVKPNWDPDSPKTYKT